MAKLYEMENVEEKNLVKDELLKVLIVDDELDICYLLSGILQQKKLRTRYVNSLSDAEVALRNDPPDILFLDNYLPDGLGIDFIQYVKKNYGQTRIIMITAHDGEEERKKAHAEGVDFFIAKPFTRELINNTIDRLVWK